MMIHSHTLTGARSGPRLLIIGGVHGDEYEPIAAIRRLQQSIDPTRLTGQVTLAPIVNLPAFRELRRTGPDGLDLARVFPGRADGTITEQIAHAAAAMIRNSDYLIDLHTGGLAMQISPLCGYMLHDNLAVLDAQRRMAKAFNLPIVWGTTPTLDGRSLSVARDANVPAVYAEWGGGSRCHADGVRDYVDGCVNVLAELEMYEAKRPQSRVTLFVEDFREQSGVLQRNYPAQRAGYFESTCELDDIVQPGDLLGEIHACDGEPPLAVSSTQSGRVILLRTIPAVNPGDCLAVVLETGDAA